MREISRDAFLAGGLVELVARDGVADPLELDPARRDRWRTLATEGLA